MLVVIVSPLHRIHIGASAAGVGAIVIFVVVIYNRKRCLSLIQKLIFKKIFADHNLEDFIKSHSFLVPK